MNYSNRCTEITGTGVRCLRSAEEGSDKCWQHNKKTKSKKVTENKQCKEKTKSGNRCMRNAMPGSTRCWQHQRSESPKPIPKPKPSPKAKKLKSILKSKRSVSKKRSVKINVSKCDDLPKKICTDNDHRHCMFHKNKCVDKFGVGRYNTSTTKKKHGKPVLL